MESSLLHTILAQRTGFPLQPLTRTVSLFEEGMTIPFVARYRKEATGGMDEVQLAAVKKELDRLKKLIDRKEAIIASLKEHNFHTPALEQKIRDTWDENELEDLYLPYKPKRKTRASAAREKGLQPLADQLLKGSLRDPGQEAEKYGMKAGISAEEALQGAMDIIAEMMAEHPEIRKYMRRLFSQEAKLVSKKSRKAGEDAEKYKDYFAYSEPVKRAASHRILAIFRGEHENALAVNVEAEEENAMQVITRNMRQPG